MATLNFDESALDKTTVLYGLYSRLYNGMEVAQTVNSPEIGEIPLGDDGEADPEALSQAATTLAEYSTILMKNSAYLYASSIIEAIKAGGGSDEGGGGSSDGLGYVIRTGDNMTGLLTALYGFQAGIEGTVLLKMADGEVQITKNLDVAGNATIHGKLNLADIGLWFGDTQVLSRDGDGNIILNAGENAIQLDGDVVIDGSLTLGNLTINESGVTWGDYEFYHKGNANLATVDWTMKNGTVAGDLSVTGDAKIGGNIAGTGGFNFSYGSHPLIYSEYENKLDDEGNPVLDDLGEQDINRWVTLQSDLKIVDGFGIKFDEDYIIKVRSGGNDVVSFSAPGRILNLGDSDNGTATQYIALQSDIKTADGNTTMITTTGSGNFPNSFSAGTGNAGSAVFRTYYLSASNQGVIALKNLKFGSTGGPALYANGDYTLVGTIAYNMGTEEMAMIQNYGFLLQYKAATSPFRDLSSDAPSLNIDTDGQFFTFHKPIEAEYFAIQSEQYKTRLIENALFFDDEVFLEGLSDGIRHSGNSYFDSSLSSRSFSSGFTGSGFGIISTTSGYAATFDELTLRKKLRAYEFEVQKISATNGSFWVSDSCSGDEVRAIE